MQPTKDSLKELRERVANALHTPITLDLPS